MIPAELTSDIDRTHADLSPEARRFLDYAREHPAALRPFDQRLARFAGVQDEFLIHYKYPIQTWPVLLRRRKLREIEHATVQIPLLLRSLPERAFGNDPKRISEFYGIGDEALVTLYQTPPDGLEEAVARCDLIDTESGLKCVEVNQSANIGGWQIRFWEAFCRRHPPNARFLEQEELKPRFRDPLRTVIHHMVKTVLSRGIATQGVLNVALVFDADDVRIVEGGAEHMKDLYHRVLASVDPALEGELVIASYPGRFAVRKGIFLYHDEAPVHALLQYTAQATPPNVFRCFKAETLSLFNSPLANVLANKVSLAMLSELADTPVFDARERAVVHEHVPWSRKVTEAPTTFQDTTAPAPELLRTRREDMVLKRGMSYQGLDVFVGRFTAAAEWERRVDVALAEGGWVAQEYLRSRPYLFQHGDEGCCAHDAVWGTFCFGRTYGGGFLRLAPRSSNAYKGVLNSARGAVGAIFYEI